MIYLIYLILVVSCKNAPEYYTTNDFNKAPKIDDHFHFNAPDVRYLKFAGSLNFRLVSPNTDAEMSIDEQLKTTASIKQQYPQKFAFLGTFSVDSFNYPGFAEKTIARIEKCMKLGASGIKIWKNIGMVLKDTAGRFVMVDNQVFDSIFNYMEEHQVHLLAHLGEPRNCWLPESEMTVDNDRRYYKEHPQYHMFLHPDEPSYEDQINARDNLLKKHPRLNFIGAHLASLEWNVDELAKRFDEFPNMKADLGGRMGSLQYQSLADREQVRNFLIKYQDRILYGSDMGISKRDANYVAVSKGIRIQWFEDWAYLATDSTFVIKNLGNQQVKGLQLPRQVVDKIFCRNAEQTFGIGKSGVK